MSAGGTTSTQAQLAVELLITGSVGVVALFGHWMFSKFTRLAEIKAEGTGSITASPHGVVVAGTTVYVSGCTGVDISAEAGTGSGRGTEMGGGGRGEAWGGEGERRPSKHQALPAETQAACNKVKAILRSAGCSVDSVVKLTVYTAAAGVDGAGDEDALMRVISAVCAENFAPKGAFITPCVTMLTVNALEGGARVMVDAVATL